MQITGQLTPEEFWDQYDRMERLLKDSASEIPCYGLSTWSGPVAINDWDLGSHPPTAAGLGHGPDEHGRSLNIWTTTQDGRTFVAHRRLAEAGPPTSGDDLARRLNDLLAQPFDEQSILVDNTRVPCEVWHQADQWWGIAALGRFCLILQGKKMAPELVSLDRVHDLEPYLQGRRAQIRSSRGES